MLNTIQKTDNHDTKVSTPLSKIHSEFMTDVKLRLDAFFDSLASVLLVFEQTATTDYKQALTCDALKIVIEKRQILEGEFVASLNSAYKFFEQGNYDFFINENLKINNYQQSAKNSNEDDETSTLLILINKTDEASAQSLRTLMSLFSKFADNKSISLNQLPISPFVVVNSFAKSIKKIDLNSTVRLLIYNTFDVNVLVKTGRIYEKLVNANNSQLEALDDIEKHSKKDSSIDSKYAIIDKLFKRRSKQQNNNNNKKPNISKSLIIQTLNIIQDKIILKYKTDANYILNAKQLKLLLRKGVVKLNKNAAKMSFDQSDLDVITLVAMLFQYITRDKSIPITLKLILTRLHVPILKIALQDTRLFKDNSNSIRLLLNQMSFVPDGFSDELNSDNKYIGKLEEITADILKQSSYEFNYYDNLLDELNKFAKKMKKRFDLVQKRIKEKAVGLEKISQVKNRVTEILDKKMHDKYMPVFIRDLLLKTWNNVLVLEHLRHPAESKACLSKVDFIDLLLACSKSDAQQIIGVEDIKNISMQFIEGLDLVAFNSKDLNDKNNELLSFLIKVHGLEAQIEAFENIKYQKQNHNVILYLKNDNFNQNELTGSAQVSDYFDKKARSLTVGSWLEFLDNKSKLIRAKISWISPITGRYLLVNSNGVRLADRSPEEIAEGFRNKTSNELHTIPLIDRALLEIAKQLNQKA